MKKRALFITAIVIFIIVLITVFTAFRTNSGGELEQIATAMIDKNIDPQHITTAEKYHRNPQATFETDLEQKLEKVVPFGTALLSMYQLDKAKTQYLEDVEDLIRRINIKLGGPVKSNQKVPWGTNWYECSVSLTRLLAMYEYIGKDEDVMNICHNRILEIIPKLNQSLGWERKGEYVLFFGIPRLLTLKKNEPGLYGLEKEKEEFNEINEQMNMKINTDNNVKNGIYQDYSCIRNDSVATFSGILSIGGFYFNVYQKLGLPENISTSVPGILNKILHPKLNFIPYGLLGREPRITCDRTLKNHWPDYKKNPNFDVNIFPFIGLGVFKSKKFVFSVRVQRDKIAAYESDKDNQQFALGWIQMRKLYHAEIDYSKYKNDAIKWEELKLQPGVVSFAKDEDNKFDAFRPMKLNDTLKSYCEDIKSFIGHLKNPKDKKLLYWFNKYKFKAFYEDEVEILEVGVCTDNGLVMRYEIKNQSGKNLKLILKDKDIGNKMSIKPLVDDSGAGILINNSTSPVTVNWYQLFDATIEPKTVDWNDTNNSVSFTFDDESYLIEQHNNYHIVKCNDRIILAGNPSSLRKGSITHTDSSSGKVTVFERDPNTLMYVPQQS